MTFANPNASTNVNPRRTRSISCVEVKDADFGYLDSGPARSLQTDLRPGKSRINEDMCVLDSNMGS